MIKGSDHHQRSNTYVQIIIMPPSSHVFMPFVLLFIFRFLSLSHEAEMSSFCSNTTTFTPNSTYQSNLNLLLSYLTSNSTNDLGFYNTTVGAKDPATAIYGSFLCRGDYTPQRCQECVSTIAREGVQQYCPLRKISLIWYEDCMLRYSNTSFFGNVEFSPSLLLYNTANVTEPDSFMELLGQTMNSLVAPAANAPSGTKKFATKEVNFTAFQIPLYTLVQCTPDLSSPSCESCLRQAIGFLPVYYYGKQGGVVVFPSCNTRHEIYPYYTAAPPPPQPAPSPSPLLLPSPPPSQGSKSKNSSSRTIIIIVVPIVLSLALIISLYVFLRKRKQTLETLLGEDKDEIITPDSLQFDFETIRVATNNFSEANKLGQGGFGPVYKGRLLNGEDIAVKRLSINSGQGDLEFKNEVLLVAKLQHRNLVRLLGFCLERNEKLLVYEFVPNTSLDHILFDRIKREHLDWPMRYKIIVGITRGLLYLHEDSRLRIIHRDLKASNILIDAEMNPKISDFGMAKMFVVDQTQGNTSRIVGTYGYMAPEYAMHGQFSVKSDVYSFGVLVLEMISGQKNNCFRQGENVEDLLSYAWKSWREGTASNLVDPTLRNGLTTEILRCIHIGLLCVQENVADRPTMASIILMLNSYSLSLPLPSQPAFFMHSNIGSNMSLGWENNSGVTGSSDGSKSNSANESKNEVSYSELYPR